MPKHRKWPLPAALCWQWKLGLEPPRPDESKDDLIKRLSKEALEKVKIAELARITESELGIKMTRANMSLYFNEIGVATGRTKMTPEKIEKAVEMAESGSYKQREIAKEIGEKYSTVISYTKGRYPLKEKECPRCNKTFKQNVHKQVYCSLRCGKLDYYKVKHPKHETYPCAQCEKPFVKTSGRKIYCDECGTPTESSRRHREKMENS